MKTTKIKKFTAMLLSVMLVLSMCITGIGASAAEAGDVTYIVAGVSDLCGLGETGYGWDAADTTNEMTANEDGTYSKVYTDVKVMNDYQLKITATDAAGATTWYGVDGGEDNFTFHVVEVCDVTVTFNPATLKISVTGAGVKIPTGIDIDAIRTVGNGDGTWLNGVNWDPADDSNTMTEIAPNVYEITYTDIEEFDNYEFKFAANGSWAVNWGGTYAGSGVETNAEFNKGNITVDVPYEMADVTIRLDLTNFNFADKTGAKFTVTVVNTGDPIETDPIVTDPIETDPIIPTEPVEVGYCLFGCIDGANYGCEEDYATIGDYVFEDGTLTATFAEASYVAVKTTDNANWYMTDGWAGIVNTVTLYNTSVLDTTADKLMVPAGEVTFTLVENEDGTLTLSYVADEVPTIPVQTDPVETVPTDPVEVGYCLFGYIDGANYGCEEDYATIGDYVFVDGTVTATFAETSYVAVKTTDNANWFMTDDWAGEVTEVTLYNASLLDETANKLMVPAGEVTFTLVENEDGTLTLSYVAKEVPTDPIPTDPTPTEPVLPADKVTIYGDFNVELKEEDTNIYTGTVDLDEGSYEFRVNEFGVKHCYKTTVTDVMEGLRYSDQFGAATTLNATGGRYTFQYNTNSNILVITFKPYSELVELFGDVNVELFRATDTVFSGSARLDAGTYTFRINEMGQQMCFGYTFTDSVVGIEFRPDWTGATTFVATGGIYTINYDTEANKLTFMHAPKGLGEVRIFGSLGIDLAVEKGTSYYSASKVLEAGEYTFRVDEMGTTMCFGGKFTDTMWQIAYSPDYKAATTFNATGGKYTFRYNAETNQLTIFCFAVEEKVSVYGDINLELQSADGVKYTGTTTLEAGTYSFRIDDFGISYCFGGTQTDYISNITYSKDYASATTFIATGGEYSFSYDKNTHKVNVAKIA